MLKKADVIIDAIDYTARSMADLCVGQSPAQMIDLETVDSESVLVCRGGGLLSVIEIKGCGSVVGDDEFAKRIGALTEIFRTRLSPGSGHSVKIIFESDPDNIKDDLNNR